MLALTESYLICMIKLRFLFCISVLGLPAVSLDAQQFYLQTGPVSDTPSDSRSVNFIDVNGDGWEDLFISNGLKGGQPDLLYLNDGKGQLLPTADADIVQLSDPSDGAAFADVDNDGDLDGAVATWYGAVDRLYRNDGQGKLSYQESSGIAPGSFAETAAFGDYDNDGWIDLYITNSGGDKHNFLYRNNGDGSFERIFDHILVEDTKLSRAAIWADLNVDGKLDLLVCNEENAANDVFLGTGNGIFERLQQDSLALMATGSMTASLGDIDNDGDFDVFIGNSGYFSPQKNQLFRNTDEGFIADTAGLIVNTSNCTYGSAFGDFDNDGDLDLAISNGYCKDGLPNALYENRGDSTFKDVSEILPSNLPVCSFGIAWGDVNNDGFLDLAVANCKNDSKEPEPANALMINEGNDNHWLQIRLNGKQSNTAAIGAKVRIKANIGGREVWQIREVRSQSGYAGQNSLRLHFGLGDAVVVDSLEIHWPAGGMQLLSKIKVDQLLEVTEE